MPNYTLNTTTSQEAVLSWVVKQYNLEHETQLTNADYIALRFPQLIGPYVANYQEALGADVVKAMLGADSATQAKVLSLLGVTP